MKLYKNNSSQSAIANMIQPLTIVETLVAPFPKKVLINAVGVNGNEMI